MYKAFDVITGSSFGGVSDREMAADILAAGAQRTGLTDQRDLWEELARTDDDDIDVDSYTDGLNALCDEHGLLPPYTCLVWQDNELTVLPCVEIALEDCRYENAVGDELPDDWLGRDHFCVVNDHGNVTLYTYDMARRDWREVWAVV